MVRESFQDVRIWIYLTRGFLWILHDITVSPFPFSLQLSFYSSFSSCLPIPSFHLCLPSFLLPLSIFPSFSLSLLLSLLFFWLPCYMLPLLLLLYSALCLFLSFYFFPSLHPVSFSINNISSINIVFQIFSVFLLAEILL